MPLRIYLICMLETSAAVLITVQIKTGLPDEERPVKVIATYWLYRGGTCSGVINLLFIFKKCSKNQG